MTLIKLLMFVVVGIIMLFVVVACSYPYEYVRRVVVYGRSTSFDWKYKFPSHPLYPSPHPYYFEKAPDPRVAQLFCKLAGTDDWDRFLEKNYTQDFIVIQNGKILYENYFNDTKRDTIVTSFSIAKSFTSALVGIAIQEGYIHSVDDPITKYLPELAKRDPRFNAITIKHLLLMASGLKYHDWSFFILNGDDPLRGC